MSEIKVIRRGDKVVLIRPDLPAWAVTNEVGYALLPLLESGMSIEEIAEEAVAALPGHKKSEICRFVEQIRASGILLPEREKTRRIPYRLNIVHLSLTDQCNLRCIYCYAAERKESRHPLMTADDYRRFIDDLLTISPDVNFTLTGGEPLLSPFWEEIAEYIRGRGQEVDILTNGTLITEHNIDDIHRLFSCVRMSIDGPTREIHSLTRGDNLVQVMRAVGLLESSNTPYSLSMTVTKKNISYIEEMARLWGNKLHFAPYFPIHGKVDELAITGDEYFKALKSAAGVNPLGYCESSLDSASVSPCRKCAMGDGEISLSPYGDIYPCQLLHVPEFLAGNVHDKSIVEIYNNSEVLKRCRALDSDIMEGCRDCAIRRICGGSCRARAYYECGKVDASSPFCHYEQEAYLDGIISIYQHNIINWERTDRRD